MSLASSVPSAPPTDGRRGRWWRPVGRILLVALAAVLVPVGAAALAVPRAVAGVYPEPGPRPLAPADRPGPPSLDPGRPTVAIVLGEQGANVADSLAPYEVFARSEAFNVVLVAPTSEPVPLTGGLDVVPDLTLAELDSRLPGPADVIVVPQVNGPTTAVVEWLKQQERAGAPLVMSVCVGAGVLADAGLLEERRATSNWLGLIGLRRSHPEVGWVDGVRFVDTGDVVTTAGVLSGIDGSLRVVERVAGADVARRVAQEVRWTGYDPADPEQSIGIPVSRPRPADLVALLSAGFRWDRPTTGVLLTEGVGEIELASAFRPYTELSYLSTLQAVSADGAPVRSSHGLTFVPRSDWASSADALDRLVVPGAQAARARAAAALPGERKVGETAYLHDDDTFPFVGTLRDIATAHDAATATWVAKSLEYPRPALPDDTDRWPWAPTLRLAALAAMGAGLMTLVLRLRRRS